MKSACNINDKLMTVIQDKPYLSLSKYVQRSEFVWFQEAKGSTDVCCNNQKSLGREKGNM